MINPKALFRFFPCFLLLSLSIFSLALAGTSRELQEYDESFPRSRHPRAGFTEFEGIPFGITWEEFKKLAGKRDDIKLVGDRTIDRGRKGGRRFKVFIKGKGHAGPVQGRYYLFELGQEEKDKVLGQVFFTPEEERLHKILIIFPDRLYSDMGEIEKIVRHWYGVFGRDLGVPDYVSGSADGEWGPQKNETLTRKTLKHPRVGKGSEARVFSAWFHPEGDWMILIVGDHFQYDPNRYQALLELSFNYPRGFGRD